MIWPRDKALPGIKSMFGGLAMFLIEALIVVALVTLALVLAGVFLAVL